MSDYVLVTTAHNEEAFIEKTCASVVGQTTRPKKWIVVNDASTDGTASIVLRYQKIYPALIEMRNVRRPPGRDFRHKAHAFNLGFSEARTLNTRYIGNLDADISLAPDYYEAVLSHFTRDSRLGIAGGRVCSYIDDRFVPQNISADSVAGAVQLFRRECFVQIGGYMLLAHGGVDAAAEIMARRLGWRVQTVASLHAFEHRRTGSATAGALTARVREGVRLYSLGYSAPFFFARCVRRAMESPRVLGSLAALYGYLRSAVRSEAVVLPPEIVGYLKGEQRRKLLRLLRLPAWL
jgi:glycosyltransferase involved in cell wall biosynthesis